MSIAPHRQTPHREREQRERAWALAEQRLRGQRICARCGATLSTYEERCEANLGELCPGANVLAAMRARVEREMGIA